MEAFFGGFEERRRVEVVCVFQEFCLVRFLDVAGNAYSKYNLWYVPKHWVFQRENPLPITGSMLAQSIVVGQRVTHYIPLYTIDGSIQYEIVEGVVTEVGADYNTIHLARGGRSHTYLNTCTRVELALDHAKIATFVRERREQERQEKLQRDIEEARAAKSVSTPVTWWRRLRAAVSKVLE